MALEDYLVRINKRKNPCWDCATHIMACPWLHKDEPVPGWTARKVSIKGKSRWHITYAVEACPLFREHSKERLAKIIEDGPECRSARTFY